MGDTNEELKGSPPCKRLKLRDDVSAADKEAVRQSDYLSYLVSDYREASDALLGFMDPHSTAALCTALRFNKRACHVLEVESRWTDLMELHCGVAKEAGGNGYVPIKKPADPMDNLNRLIVRPTVRAFGCSALVDFLSLRSQIHHATHCVFVVEGDSATIASVGGHYVDFRLEASEVARFYAAILRARTEGSSRLQPIADAYEHAFDVISDSKSATCAVLRPLVTGILPAHQFGPGSVMFTLRDAIFTRDFNKKIAFVTSSKMAIRAFKDAHVRMIGGIFDWLPRV